MSVESDFRQVLAQLEMTSNGRIYSYEPVGTGGSFQSGEPKSGDGYPPHVFWALEWRRSNTDAHQQRTLDGARGELDRLRKRTLPDGFTEQQEPPAMRNDRLLKQGAGIPLHEAAFRLNCPPGELLRLRKNNGRDAYNGFPVHESAGDPRQVRRARVSELKSRHPGMTNRQIAQLVGCDHKTVATDLRDAA